MTGSETGDRFADAWRVNHAYLVDLAFRMLADIGVAEDVVQEAFARLARTAHGEVEDARGWLTVVTSRLCLDHIRAARTRRERAQDTAVLESAAPLAQPPPVDPADRVTLDDEVRLALSVVLERLSPAERVAFVLHDVFQTPFEAVAETLGKPIGTCRQLARRARQKIAAMPARRHDVPLTEHRLVTETFIAACAGGDLNALLALLHPQVWGVAAFNADPPIEPEFSHGAASVARALLQYYGDRTVLVSHPMGGEHALLAYIDHKLFAVLTLTVDHNLITKIQATVNIGAGAPDR